MYHEVAYYFGYKLALFHSSLNYPSHNRLCINPLGEPPWDLGRVTSHNNYHIGSLLEQYSS